MPWLGKTMDRKRAARQQRDLLLLHEAHQLAQRALGLMHEAMPGRAGDGRGRSLTEARNDLLSVISALENEMKP